MKKDDSRSLPDPEDEPVPSLPAYMIVIKNDFTQPIYVMNGESVESALSSVLIDAALAEITVYALVKRAMKVTAVSLV